RTGHGGRTCALPVATPALGPLQARRPLPPPPRPPPRPARLAGRPGAPHRRGATERIGSGFPGRPARRPRNPERRGAGVAIARRILARLGRAPVDAAALAEPHAAVPLRQVDEARPQAGK